MPSAPRLLTWPPVPSLAPLLLWLLLTGVPVGAGVRKYANEILPTYHAGDVLVSIEAQVNGGIGPQRSASTLIIKT